MNWRGSNNPRRPFAVALAAACLLAASLTPALAEESKRYLVRYQLGSKAEVVAALGASATVHHEFDDLGVLAATLPVSRAGLVAELGAVLDVSEDPLRFLSAQTVPYGIDLVRARDEWDADRDGVVDAGAATGAGIRVCIVDTGIYAAHEDLGGGGVTILAGRSWVGEDWDRDLQGHGTHVAGTVVAMNNQLGVVGTSPGEIELIIADVFNDAGDGQASSTILAAANWCADQGADIISMSLGGLLGTLADGYQALYDRGILVIAAAGNDGGPVQNYPAASDSVVSVAAIDSTETVADFSNFVPQVEVAAPGVAVLSTYPFENSLAIDGGPTFAANSIANANPSGAFSGPLADGGDCNTAPPAGAYTGAIVLCERGGTAFRVKIDNAAAGGAAGAVLYNNAPGNFNGTYGDPCCSSIPAISLSQADGQAALAWLGSNSVMTVDLESAGGYAELSGTSMATPHASATAAVAWSACPELSNDQMRSHLSATTRESQADLVPSRDIFYGWGIVQVKDGVDALADGVDEYDPAFGNGDGTNPANVECASDPDDAPKTTGGGWLAGDGKINFGFNAKQAGDGVNGQLQLNDHGSDTRIHISRMTGLFELTSDCGPVAAGPGAVELTGDGSLNSQPASFRVCVADRGEPGRGSDEFYLECTSGCSYDTAAAGAGDGVLGGGNIQVHGSPSAGGSGASSMTLGPVLLSGGDAGQLQVLTARVWDGGQRPLGGAVVTLEATAADGSVERWDGVTGANGTAVFTVVLPSGAVEYRATAGAAESNTVRAGG